MKKKFVSLSLALRRIKTAAGVPGALVVIMFFAAEGAANIAVDLTDSWFWKLGYLGALGVAGLVLAARWSHRIPNETSIGHYASTSKVAARRGIVLVAGVNSAEPDSAAMRLLVQARNLQFLAVVSTPEAMAAGTLDRIVGPMLDIAQHRLSTRNIRVWATGNAESLGDFNEATTEAIEWMFRQGLAPSEVVVDISAGRRPMTYGAVLAATTCRVEAQYLAPLWDRVANRPIAGTEGFKVLEEYWDDGLDYHDSPFDVVAEDALMR